MGAMTPNVTALRALAGRLRSEAEHLERLAEHLEPAVGPARAGPATHLGVEEAASALGVGRSTVFRLLAAGALDSVHLGRRRWVTAASVDALLAAAIDRAG